jgi:N,N'-diacetyllegionaminate synthase
MTVRIRNKTIGEGQPLMIIAEIASAHEGRFDDLLKLIDSAQKSNADAVKFQVLDADKHMTEHHRLYDLVRRLEFSKAQWKEAVAYARRNTDLLVLADAYDEGGLDIIAGLDVDMIKIHSSDLSNFSLIKNVASLKKPTLMGVGASSIKEIREGLRMFRLRNVKSFVGLLHGYQAFPTRLDELNIRQITTLRRLFRVPVGFLDHTEGDTEESLFIGLAARALGAFAVEKHIVLDRSKKGIDHESALSVDYFQKFVRWMRATETALGSEEWRALTLDEIKYRDLMKKTIVASAVIKPGERLTAAKLSLKRSSPGFSGADLKRLLGRKVKVEIKKDQTISREMMQ